MEWDDDANSNHILYAWTTVWSDMVMTWLPDLIEKAKKALEDNPDSDSDLDLIEFECEATPSRIIALGECIEAGKKLDEAWGDNASIYAVSNARIVWKDKLTRLDALGDK